MRHTARRNQGFSEEEALEKAREALVRVKLPEKYWEMSPFELSGGQKRRAAIAGVIAMNPKVLILDDQRPVWIRRGGMNCLT